jgi:hypothetical protein
MTLVIVLLIWLGEMGCSKILGGMKVLLWICLLMELSMIVQNLVQVIFD